jgi:hypothetical protein
MSRTAQLIEGDGRDVIDRDQLTALNVAARHLARIGGDRRSAVQRPMSHPGFMMVVWASRWLRRLWTIWNDGSLSCPVISTRATDN